MFIGEIVDAKQLSDKSQMTYAYYQQIKRGTTPKSAPSYINEKKESTLKVKKYICSICNYVYDPVIGDPNSGVRPGILFEELPKEWTCPICGATKIKLKKKKKPDKY